MNLLEKTVKVTTRVGQVEYTGKVVKQENHIIWIELDNARKDQLKFFTDWDKVEVPEEEKTGEELLEEWLEKNGYDWDAYGFGDDTNYQIAGFTYNVTCYYDAYDSEWILFTTHKGRFERENDIMNDLGDTAKADGNEVRRKRLSAVKNYIEKWTDK